MSDREIRRPVRPVMVSLRCANCRDGEMRSTNVVQPTDPMRYLHRCTRCGAEEALHAVYPALRYEDVAEKTWG
jgi:hypothetical protein